MTAKPWAFWDSSALVLLCVDQHESKRARAIARSRGAMVTWWASRVEIASALARLRRSDRIAEEELRRAKSRLKTLAFAWSEVEPTIDVRDSAFECIERHDLRAADAFQLAAALVASDQKPRRRAFVCFDERLADAASKEGFAVTPE